LGALDILALNYEDGIPEEKTSEIDDHEGQEECHCYKTCDLIDVAEKGDLSEEVRD
jgi:hypothetical protein